MKNPVRMSLKAVVNSRAEAEGLIKVPGDAVLIERGRPRWLLINCPCGCGETYPVNLDPAAGKAWRIYKNEKHGITIFPSIWRDTACQAHYIIWRNRFDLFGFDSDEYGEPADYKIEMAELKPRVLEKLSTNDYRSFVDVADELGVVPWDVLRACKALCGSGLAREGVGPERSAFQKRPLDTGSGLAK